MILNLGLKLDNENDFKWRRIFLLRFLKFSFMYDKDKGYFFNGLVKNDKLLKVSLVSFLN